MLFYVNLVDTGYSPAIITFDRAATTAPGDEGPLCQSLRELGIAPTPAYSDNMRVLMDSWNYQNLLAIGANQPVFVWQQVDNDVNNPFEITTNVSLSISFIPDSMILQANGYKSCPIHKV